MRGRFGRPDRLLAVGRGRHRVVFLHDRGRARRGARSRLRSGAAPPAAPGPARAAPRRRTRRRRRRSRAASAARRPPAGTASRGAPTTSGRPSIATVIAPIPIAAPAIIGRPGEVGERDAADGADEHAGEDRATAKAAQRERVGEPLAERRAGAARRPSSRRHPRSAAGAGPGRRRARTAHDLSVASTKTRTRTPIADARDRRQDEAPLARRSAGARAPAA